MWFFKLTAINERKENQDWTILSSSALIYRSFPSCQKMLIHGCHGSINNILNSKLTCNCRKCITCNYRYGRNKTLIFRFYLVAFYVHKSYFKTYESKRCSLKNYIWSCWRVMPWQYLYTVNNNTCACTHMSMSCPPNHSDAVGIWYTKLFISNLTC